MINLLEPIKHSAHKRFMGFNVPEFCVMVLCVLCLIGFGKFTRDFDQSSSGSIYHHILGKKLEANKLQKYYQHLLHMNFHSG